MFRFSSRAGLFSSTDQRSLETRWMLAENTKKTFCLAFLLTGWDSKAWSREVPFFVQVRRQISQCSGLATVHYVAL